jgi:hypothetical protein
MVALPGVVSMSPLEGLRNEYPGSIFTHRSRLPLRIEQDSQPLVRE